MQHPIACGMAVRVVDLFEVVDVHQQCAQRQAVAAGGSEHRVGLLLESAQVVQPSQFVGARGIAGDAVLDLQLAAQPQQRAQCIGQFAGGTHDEDGKGQGGHGQQPLFGARFGEQPQRCG